MRKQIQSLFTEASGSLRNHMPMVFGDEFSQAKQIVFIAPHCKANKTDLTAQKTELNQQRVLTRGKT